MESYPSEKLRILLFEDKSVLQQAVKNLLENYGCSVLVASNFSEAVKNLI
ncbi:MAG: hypothetical protein LRY30_00315 [Gammaproteobacteria bacterium]|nr:hypothetical protein [Gammaproteobacteria bacterium]